MLNPQIEVLLKERKEVLLARVLLVFDAPLKKYPKFGIYTYLLKSGKEVILFDAGPKYNTLLGFKKKPTPNTSYVLQALKQCFPGKTVREILISHYHFDHSENAPALQEALLQRQGNRPPIRLHANELQPKKYLTFFSNSLSKIYRQAGYTGWVLGNPLQDGEQLKGTDFQVLHTPGHTSGTISLVNQKAKVTIGGWWLTGIKNPLVSALQNCLIDEDRKSYPQTYKRSIIPGHLNFTYHPQLRYAFYTL